MAFAPSLEGGGVTTVIGNDEEHGAGGNEHRQEDLDGCAAVFSRAAVASMNAPPGVGRTVSVESMTAGSSSQDALSGSSDVGSNAESEPSSDLAAQEADALLLATVDVGGDESEREAVAAEDWLDISHALLEKVNQSG